MENQLDRLLAAYCSPALAGIKPANLVSCDRTIYPDLPEQLETYREAFAPRGMRFEIVCACRARYLLLVYNEAQLERYMRDERSTAALSIRTPRASAMKRPTTTSSTASPPAT